MMLKQAVLMVVFLAGCGGSEEIGVQTEETTLPALTGCWDTATPGGSYDLTLNADGTCAYAGTKTSGKPVAYACSWSADVNRLVLTAPSWTSPLAYDYSVDASTLTLTPFAPTSGPGATWTRVVCN